MIKRLTSVILLLVLVLVSGCSTYTERNAALRGHLVNAKYELALDVVSEAEEPADELLNLLERATILHYADKYSESNIFFEQAEQLAADLHTKSISQNIAALATNDETVDYTSPLFEMSLIPYYRALNYHYLGFNDEAAVEARKALEFLRDNEIESYHFLNWFCGALLENVGDLNDAHIAWKNAIDGSIPGIGFDLQRSAELLGFDEEFEPSGNGGKVVLFLESGFAPHKVSLETNIPIYKDDDPERIAFLAGNRVVHGWQTERKLDYWLTVALPDQVVVEPSVTAVKVALRQSSVVENIAVKSIKAFDDGMTKTAVRAAGRALVKAKMHGKAKDSGGEVAAFLMNVFNVATERADTRSWLTLPHSISMLRLDLEPGIHTLEVKLLDIDGRVVGTETISDINVEPGKWRFFSRRVF